MAKGMQNFRHDQYESVAMKKFHWRAVNLNCKLKNFKLRASVPDKVGIISKFKCECRKILS
jgi:hypothetical protein